MIKLRANFRRCERGATIVEMALVLGTAVVLILGMMEYAVAYWYQHNLLLAVEQAGRYGMIHNADATVAADAAQNVCTAINQATGSGSCTNIAAGGACTLSAGQYCTNATTATNANGTKILTVTAKFGFSFINITGSDMTLTGQTTVPLN